MFDFNSVDAPARLNRDFVLSKITDAQIFYYYFGNFDLKNVYPSKFHKDRNPSTGFYVSKSGKIIYNHLNNKEPKMDCFAFVQRLYQCEFRDAVKRIALDFGLISGNPTPMADKIKKAVMNFDRTYKKQTKIHFEYSKWTPERLAFWKEYHIGEEELKKNGVYPIKKLYINEILIPNHKKVPRFALTIPYKGEMLTKVYSPAGDDLKWVSNIPNDLPFGASNLDRTAPFCFVTKAVKDKIIIEKFLPAVIASQNESKGAMSDHTIKNLMFYFDKNYIGWDNDETGLEAMEEMSKHGFTPVHVPVELLKEGIKDFSDLAKAKGLKAVEQLLKQQGVI